MPDHQPQIRILVLSDKPASVDQMNQNTHHESITFVKDLPTLQNAIASHPYDGIVLEGPEVKLDAFMALNGSVDLSRTFFLAGPLPALSAAHQLRELAVERQKKPSNPRKKSLNLADYVEHKFEDFVRTMKLASAQNLYPTLMRAVERPLIELALRETNGNQVQAAQLLGVNRNTLRKKIGEFQIPVKRRKTHDRHKKPE